MLFSVVIPTFNRANLLLRTLDSVRQQRRNDYELIIVDDGSTDGTRERLRGLTEGEATIIEQENLGPGAARNARYGPRSASEPALTWAHHPWIHEKTTTSS